MERWEKRLERIGRQFCIGRRYKGGKLDSILGAQNKILQLTNRPAAPPPPLGISSVFSAMINGGNPGGGGTGETRSSRPGVPLNKSRGGGTSGSFGGAGVRVGEVAGGELVA